MTSNSHSKAQLTALSAAIFLHGSIAAYAMMPSAPIVIPEQVIRISMVAPSSDQQSVAKQEVQEEQVVTPPKPDGLKKQVQKKPKLEQKQLDKLAKRNSQLNPTSGMQSPDATQKQAAITEPVFNAAYLNNPAPAYPDPARRRGIQGKAMIQVEVTADGQPRDVIIARSSGSSLLDEAALNAVKRWRFIPAKRGGETVEAKVLVPVEFKLN